MKFDHSTENAPVEAFDLDSTYAFVHGIADELGLSDTHDIDAIVLQTANEMGLDDAVPSHPTTSGITATLLRAIQALGPEGVEDAGGLPALARQYRVRHGSLCRHFREDGSLTPRGKAKIQENMLPPTKKVTATLLCKIQALGPEGIKNAGGRLGLARRYSVKYRPLCNYIHEDGSLTPLGKAKIQENMRPPTELVTASLLQEIQALGPQRFQDAGGRPALARQHRVSCSALSNYISGNGSLNMRGVALIYEATHPPTELVTASLLKEIQALGPQRFQDAGGRPAWARRHRVSYSSLSKAIRRDGSLTPLGEAKIRE
ncbi:hypothetical protein [Burkholderia ambifaria]|uniref:hypothetical protein n=2 Tax=Burkholderia ambifaria TaxID=152480 RepID=UPI00158D4F10|nr:hypothetical protein [Burkholderia ambifaria]